MSEHGRLFDQFSARASHAHGGSYFDAGFGHRTLASAHGKLYDLFGAKQGDGGHGELYDDFGWTELPATHGAQFDSDFGEHTANTGGHGTWFDVFTGGTQVKFMLEGADYEGTVIDCHRDYANVKGHDGQIHEVGLSQFLAYRTPNEQQAGPSMPASDAHAPSAHSADAHGAFHGERFPVPTDMPPVVQEAPQGQYTEPRSGVPDGLMSTFTHLKSLADDLDVVKSVDSTETAIQAKDSGSKTVGHRSNCPRGGSAPCGADVDGKCTSCGASVRDHEAVGKTAPALGGSTGDLGITVPERDHKTSDHHMQLGGKPRRCPHCDGELDELDEKTEQGQAHKCVGTGLDVLKSLMEA